MIQAEGLCKAYNRGSTIAVSGADIQVQRGQIFGLIGPDGAGKTSVLQMLAGVLRIDAGQARILGIDVLTKSEKVKARIGYMPQGLGLNLYDKLTVAENIHFFRALRQLEEKPFQENFKRLLEMTRLQPFLDRPAGKLSGGMRQKLALICTLIHLPDVLLLDEPSTGVDPISRRDFWTIIHQLVSENQATVLLTTSYMDEAERCHQVALMHQGKIIASGDPTDLMRQVDPGQPNQPVQPNSPEKLQGGSGSALEEVFIQQVRAKSASLPIISSTVITRVSALKNPVFDLQGMSKEYGAFVAVDAVNLRIDGGEIFGLLGPNGAGKTTLIKMLCGLVPPSSGRARVGGHDIPGQIRQVRRHLGYMSQRFSLYRDISVSANLMLFARLYGLDRKQRKLRSEELLQQLGLGDNQDRLVGSLPLGVQQRLALACSLVHQPEILFLDEPTAGVDPIARRHFWQIIHGLTEQAGMTVLVSTHYMDEAENCDRLGFMNRGKLVVADTPTKLKHMAEQGAGPLLVVEASNYEKAFARLLPHFPTAMLYGRLIQWQSLDIDKDQQRAQELLTQINLSSTFSTRLPNIEESFVYFIQRENESRSGVRIG